MAADNQQNTKQEPWLSTRSLLMGACIALFLLVIASFADLALLGIISGIALPIFIKQYAERVKVEEACKAQKVDPGNIGEEIKLKEAGLFDSKFKKTVFFGLSCLAAVFIPPPFGLLFVSSAVAGMFAYNAYESKIEGLPNQQADAQAPAEGRVGDSPDHVLRNGRIVPRNADTQQRSLQQ
jgi:hypothetical protein